MQPDRNKREHVAALDRVIWSDDTQPVAILALHDGHSVVVPSLASEFSRGMAYRFLGRWEEGKRGPQFRATTWVHERPISKAAVAKYLVDHCSGIGQRTAEKLCAAYGGETATVLRTDPQRVANDGLLPIESARAAAEELARFAGMERTRIELFGLFAGRGFPGKLVERSLAKWGAKAPDVIKRDPYRLMVSKLPGAGFKRCDKMYLESGGNPKSLKRQFLAGWNALREDRTGSTWIDADRVVDAIRDAVPGPACDPIKAIKLGIRAGWLRLRRDGRLRWIAVADRARSEQHVADAIRRLSAARPEWPTTIPTTEAEGDGLPSVHQAEQLKAATAKAVGCFTGGPGTGKTHTLSFLLRSVIASHGAGSVAVCAPTGKAAKRATELLAARGLDIRATTIHRLLEIGRNGQDGDGWGFQRNADNPLSARFVIVDESSMIDTGLMADLLVACQTGTHVLFVGDTFQLAPVGHGAPLRDVIASGAVGVGELTEVRRNAGAIVRACSAIKSGASVETAERFDLDASDPANLVYADMQPEAVLESVESFLAGLSKFDSVWDCQIITATNEKSELSRKSVNERLAKVLNPDGLRCYPCPFAVRDKVVCLRNSELKRVVALGEFARPGMADHAGNYQPTGDVYFVANGEIGAVVAVSAKECVISFGGTLVVVPVGRPRKGDDDDSESKASGAMGDFDLAYALTVHKSQGSEWPVVLCLIDPAGGAVADRHFWYTAISRAKTACVLFGPRAAFESQRVRQSLIRRKTFLSELIQGEPA